MISKFSITRKYVAYLKYEKRSKRRTIQDHFYRLNLLAKKLGDLLLVESHSPIIQAVNHIEQVHGWNPNTTTKLEKAIKVFYRWALREKLIAHNPYPFSDRKGVKPPVQPHYDRKIDKEIIERILFHPNWTRREYNLLRVMFAAGLRREEVVNLNIRDIDLERGYVHVIKGKRDKERYVPLDPETVEELKVYIEGLRLNTTGQMLFPREDFKDRLTGSGIWKSLDRMGKKMGLKCNPKIWRTSFGSYFAELMPISMVSDMMGHERPSTTLDHYVYHRKQKTKEFYDAAVQQA